MSVSHKLIPAGEVTFGAQKIRQTTQMNSAVQTMKVTTIVAVICYV
jgi:hypothetical protein